MSKIATEYLEFLELTLAAARDFGPYNAGLLRRLEIGTERHLLAPARERERTGSEQELIGEREQVRAALQPIWERGPFGYEATHWPSGPGSARAMELVYENDPKPHDLSAHYTEWFYLTRDLAHAVRSRRDVLRELLVREVNARTGKLDVLDLACGPCQSLREAVHLLRDPARVQLRAIDQDPIAQDKNRGFFQHVYRLPWQFEVDNVLKADLGKEQYDIVYSTGLYDYLPSPYLARLWKRVYASLKPNGLAILAVKDGTAFCPLLYRWAIDWSQFLIRSEADFADVRRRAGLPSAEATLRDATGCIVFYLVRKPQ